MHTLFVAEAEDKPNSLNVERLYQIVREQGTVVISPTINSHRLRTSDGLRSKLPVSIVWNSRTDV